MATRVFIGGPVSGSSISDAYRQGIEISRPEYYRGANFPKILPNTTPGLIRTGSLQANYDVRFFDETLTLPDVNSLSTLSMDSPKAFTKIRLQAEQRDFGQTGPDDSSIDAGGYQPFREADKFDAKTYIELGSERYPMAATMQNAYFGNPYTYDGVIEPLTIRPIADFSTIEAPRPAHGVFGSLESSHAKDSLGEDVPIVSFYDFNSRSTDPYFDAGKVPLNNNVETMPEPGFVDATGSMALPFVDTTDKRQNASRYNDQQISSLMLANVTGSIVGFPAPGVVVATAGQVVRPTQLKQDIVVGTDSIAFAGLRR